MMRPTLALIMALVALGHGSLLNRHRPDGFVPPERHGKLGLVDEDLPRMPKDSEPESHDWPPINEPWRCLQKDEDINEVIRVELNGGRQPDCPLVDPSICEAIDFYPVPCNCHAYVECYQFDTGGPLLPCIKKCYPYDLVFDPGVKVCVEEFNAPPGTCFDTLPPPPLPYTSLMTFPSTTPTTPGTTETTETTAESTSSSISTPPESTTTQDPLGPCDGSVNQNQEYPGDCYLYYHCANECCDPEFCNDPDNDDYRWVICRCGRYDDEECPMVFDPNQGTCEEYEEADNVVCSPEPENCDRPLS